MDPFRIMALVNGATGGGGGGATDPDFSTVKLLMGFNGSNGGTTFTDESPSPVSFSTTGGGSVTTSTTNPKFGTAALRPSGASLSTPSTGSPKWLPGSGDWTVEFFACHDASNAAGAYLGCQDGFKISRLTSTVMDFYWRDSLGNNYEFQPTVAAVTANTYNHYCFEKNGLITRSYVDGVMTSKHTAGALRTMNTPSGPLLIGSNPDGGMTGYLDEVRISHMARYASDGGFTVPTAAYPRS